MKKGLPSVSRKTAFVSPDGGADPLILGQQLLHARLVQPPERDPRRQPLPQQRFERLRERPLHVELDVAVRADDEQPHRGEVRREVLQQLERRFVGPVQVVQQDHARRLLRRALDVLEEGAEDQAALLIGRHVRQRRDVAVGAAQARHDRRDLRGEIAHRRAHGLRQQPHGLLGHLDERHERRRALHLVAVAGQTEAAALPRLGHQLARETRLADARLAADQHQAAVARQHAIEQTRELGGLGVAPDERRALVRLRRRRGGRARRR